MFFCVITKNLNGKFLLKIELLLKDEMGVGTKNFNMVTKKVSLGSSQSGLGKMDGRGEGGVSEVDLMPQCTLW